MASTIKVDLSDGTTKELKPGAYSQIAAKRHLGLQAVKDEDPEAVLFMCAVEIHGAAWGASCLTGTEGSTPFDRWLQTVEDISVIHPEEDDDDADPPPAASSEPSPDSPPISE